MHTSLNQSGLDFVVLGVARSGTTAVAGYLSASHQVHCAHELFNFKKNHRRIRAPQDFLKRRSKSEIDSAAHIARKASTIIAFGNKNPRYHFRLNRVLKELNWRRGVVCFRDLSSVAQSFTMRAEDDDDRDWPQGRVGYFACADLTVLVKALAQLDGNEILIAPQKALAENWENSIRRIGQHVAPGARLTFEPSEVEKFSQKRTKSESKMRPALSAIDYEAISYLERIGVAKVLDVSEPTLLYDRRQELKAAAQALPDDLEAWVADLTERNGAAVSERYFSKWLRFYRYKNPLSDIRGVIAPRPVKRRNVTTPIARDLAEALD